MYGRKYKTATLDGKDLPRQLKGVCHIYELICPDTLQTKYIGVTNQPYDRYVWHVYKRGLTAEDSIETAKNKWVLSLIAKNKLPIMNILDTVVEDEWEFWEMYWIAQYKNWGITLKNHTEGGGGFRGLKRRKRTPEEIAAHKTMLAEYFKTNSNPNKGKRMGDAYKEKMRQASSFNKQTPEQRAAMISKRAATMKGQKRNGTNIREAHVQRLMSQPDYRCIVQMDAEGNVVKYHRTLKEAAIYINTPKGSANILVAIRKNRVSHGFMWRYGSILETKTICLNVML
jgi:hypothetical protein